MNVPAPHLVAALLIGLAGTLHCAVMCGPLLFGINQVSGLGADGTRRPGRLARLAMVLAPNLARIAVYALLGALLAATSVWLLDRLAVETGNRIRGLVAGLTLLAIGLHISNLWRGLAMLERAGFRLWQWIRGPLLAVLPDSPAGRSLGLGLCWGFLPCGLTFSALVWSSTAASAAEGAMMMAAFGLGTLPGVLAGSTLLSSTGVARRRPVLGTVVGALLMIAGGLTVLGLVGPGHHAHSAPPTAEPTTAEPAGADTGYTVSGLPKDPDRATP